MAWWTVVVDLMRVVLFAIAHVVPGGIGSALLLFSLIVRLALLPVSLRLARKQRRTSVALAQLEPELAALRVKYADDRARLASETVALCRDAGVGSVNRDTLTTWLVQAPVIGALISAVRGGLATGARFLWIGDLARPDALLTSAVVALATASATLGAKASGNPGMRALITAGALSAIVSAVWLLRNSAAYGLYWGASSAVSVVQSAILLRERRRHGE